MHTCTSWGTSISNYCRVIIKSLISDKTAKKKSKKVKQKAKDEPTDNSDIHDEGKNEEDDKSTTEKDEHVQ